MVWKRPAQRAGPHVVGADVARRGRQALADAAADDQQVLVDDARRGQRDRLASRDRGRDSRADRSGRRRRTSGSGLPVARVERVDELP